MSSDDMSPAERLELVAGQITRVLVRVNALACALEDARGGPAREANEAVEACVGLLVAAGKRGCILRAGPGLPAEGLARLELYITRELAAEVGRVDGAAKIAAEWMVEELLELVAQGAAWPRI